MSIQLEQHGAVLEVRMARPEKKNALTHAMYEGLIEAFAKAKVDDSVRAVLWTGVEGCFTAGNDLGDFMERPPTGEDAAVFRLLLDLVDFPKPLVAAVDGPAVGIGTTGLLHCDRVVATPRAKFRMPFLDLGLVPEGGSTVLLPRLVGSHTAAGWLLLAEPFDGTAAHQAGLVHALAEPAELRAAGLKQAEAFASKPPEAMRQAKFLMREPLREEVKAAIRREGKAFIERLQSPEAMEAFMAFASRGKG